MNPNADPLRDRAERRWRSLEDEQPDLVAAIGVQRPLVLRSIELLRELEAGADSLLSFPPRYVLSKLSRGVPALQGETIPPAAELLGPVLLEFSSLLAAHGGGDASRHIRDALDAGTIEPSSWLSAVLARNRTLVLQAGHQIGLAPDLLWLIGELAVAPLAHLLARNALQGVAAHGATRVTTRSMWNRGCCPGCGSWPALVEVVHNQRQLRCSFCASSWELSDRRCLYCESPELSERTPDADRPDRRLDLCAACNGYIKVVSVPEPLVFPLASIEDLATTMLDVLAMEWGHVRPQLPDDSQGDAGMVPGRQPLAGGLSRLQHFEPRT